MSRNLEPPPFGAGFLLAQLGAHSGARFAAAINHLHVSPPHVGLLRSILADPGRSQQTLATEFGLPPSRMVVLLDDLESRGLVERRRDSGDRRVHQLYVTDEGTRLMAAVMAIAADAQRDLLAALEPAEREQLAELLLRVADEQGLTRGVHPGYRTLNHPHHDDRHAT